MTKRTIKKCFYRDHKGYCQRDLENTTAVKKCSRVCQFYSEVMMFEKGFSGYKLEDYD